jgi:hypothetical protein
MFRFAPGAGITLPLLMEKMAAKGDDVQIALQNLNRLGLIVDEFPGRNDANPFYQPHAEIGTTSFAVRLSKAGTCFRPAPLGFALLKACEP